MIERSVDLRNWYFQKINPQERNINLPKPGFDFNYLYFQYKIEESFFHNLKNIYSALHPNQKPETDLEKYLSWRYDSAISYPLLSSNTPVEDDFFRFAKKFLEEIGFEYDLKGTSRENPEHFNAQSQTLQKIENYSKVINFRKKLEINRDFTRENKLCSFGDIVNDAESKFIDQALLEIRNKISESGEFTNIKENLRELDTICEKLDAFKKVYKNSQEGIFAMLIAFLQKIGLAGTSREQQVRKLVTKILVEEAHQKLLIEKAENKLIVGHKAENPNPTFYVVTRAEQRNFEQLLHIGLESWVVNNTIDDQLVDLSVPMGQDMAMLKLGSQPGLEVLESRLQKLELQNRALKSDQPSDFIKLTVLTKVQKESDLNGFY